MARYAFILACTASCFATAAGAAGSGWTITEATGSVQVLHSGVSRIVAKGGVLESGDTIQTGRSGRAVVARNDDYLVVAPNSRLRIAPPAGPGGLVQILEDFGNVVFKIKKLGVPHFGVQTPYLAAVVKGTTFSVTVTDKGASVQVTEGAVQVATLDGGASDLIRPGMIAVVSGASSNRLEVKGDTARTIISPVASAAPAVRDEEKPTEKASEARIAVAVSEDNGQLSRETDGLISGSASPALALASAYAGPAAQPRVEALLPAPVSTVDGGESTGIQGVATPAPDPVGGGGAGASPGNGNAGNANAGGASAGAGNGNAAPGNGAAAGTGNSPNGNGAAAGTGNSPNGNANGNGNGASGGNGNGNGRGNNGNGNGNGGPNGDGNGNDGKGHDGKGDDGKGGKHGGKTK